MSKRRLELIDALKTHDLAIGEHRAVLDSAARGRRYKQLAEAGAALVKVAHIAAVHAAELDAILTAEWEQRRRG